MTLTPKRSAAGIPSILNAVAEWQAARHALQAIERAECPDVTDNHGRAWTWKSGDLYVHDSMAWPRHLIERGIGLPSTEVLANPNYRWCDICIDGREAS